MLLASLFATLLATVASPSDYEKVEYLESTGTQWIDTGLNADGGLSLEIKCRLVEGTGGSQHALGAINKIDGVNYRWC